MRLSISSYNKYLSCNRLYYIEKVLGYKDISPKPWLDFGSNFGELMAFVDVNGYKAGMKEAGRLFRDPFKAAEASYLLAKWHKQYSNDIEPVLDIEGVPGNEYPIELDLSHLVNDRFELIFVGFIDKVFEKDSEPMINERKTTSDVINERSAYWNVLNFDPQTVGYSWALSQILGTSVDKGTYEVFRKPSEAIDKTLFKKPKDPVEYKERLLNNIDKRVARDAQMVARKPLFINDEMRDAWLHEFLMVAEEIHNKKLYMKELPRPEYEWGRNKDTCDKYRGCIYRDYCGCKGRLEDIEMAVKEKQ